MKSQTTKTNIMKNILLFLLLFTGISFGQIVNIPDANFKSKIIAQGVDLNFDGEIQNSEAEFFNVLDLYETQINDLTGIEAFINLQVLKIYNSPNITNVNLISTLTSLSYLRLSRCNLATIDLSNLVNLVYLDLSINQLSILNLTTLVNLRHLFCYSNQLISLNLPINNVIEDLDISSNQFTSFNFYQFPLLKTLNTSYNNNFTLGPISNFLFLEVLNITSIQVNNLSLSNLPNLKYFSCGLNNLTTLDLSPFPTLIEVECIYNNLTSINLAGLTNLKILECGSNSLTNLDLNSLTNLIKLDCRYNLLTTLNITSLQNLIDVICFENLLTTINVSGNSNLKRLGCGGINFSQLSLTNLPFLFGLWITGAPITTLDLSNTIIETLIINDTNIIDLEIPMMNNLVQSQNIISLSNNQNLIGLNIKNGVSEDLQIYECPNLVYVCQDEEYLGTVLSSINNGFGNNPNVQASSYCSFVPGGNFNTITGNVKLDVNNNGCDLLDLPINNIKFNINDGTNQGATFSNELGIYNFYTQAGNFDISPSIENPTYFNYSPITATIPFANNNYNVTIQDFCLSANGVVNDLEIVVMPVGPARPGFDAEYKIVYKNKGNQTLSGNINFTFEDAVLDYVSSSLIPNLQTTNNLSWIFNSLSPFETRTILITLNVNSPTEIPAVNLGDVLNFTTIITPLIGDELPDDNSFNYDQIVVGSYDPNDIACLEGETLSPSEIGKYLHYAIQFENTGTFQAENVVVKVEIDTLKYDLNSLQLLNTSNPVDAKITGNIVEFIFENINLAASSGNPPVGGHGDILFKIKSKNNLVNGDNVSKKANIYFDYNAPIITNIANTIYQTLGLDVNNIDHSILVSPNPTTSFVQIKSNNNIKCIELYDVQGRILLTSLENSNKIELNISDQTNGIYFLKIKTDKGTKIEKLVKN